MFPDFSNTPWYVFINNRVTRFAKRSSEPRLEFIVRFEKAGILSLAGSGSKNRFPPAVSRWKAARRWMEARIVLVSRKRREKHVCGRRITKICRERKRVAAGEEGSRQGFFAKVLVFLGSMVKGNSEDDDFYFRLRLRVKRDIGLGFHWWQGSRVDNIFARKRNAIFTRIVETSIRFHQLTLKNRACLKNSSLDIFSRKKDRPCFIPYEYRKLSMLREYE